MAKSIGQRLRTKRISLDVTQAQVAAALKTEQSMIAMIEKGSAQPGEELHGRILRWLASGSVAGRAKRGAYKR